MRLSGSQNLCNPPRKGCGIYVDKRTKVYSTGTHYIVKMCVRDKRLDRVFHNLDEAQEFVRANYHKLCGFTYRTEQLPLEFTPRFL